MKANVIAGVLQDSRLFPNATGWSQQVQVQKRKRAAFTLPSSQELPSKNEIIKLN